MDLNELLELRKNKKAELETILSNGEKEERKLNEVEDNQILQITKDIENIDKEIEEKRTGNTVKNNKIIMEENFSLIKAIRNLVEGRNFDEATIKYMEIGKKEFANAGLSYRGQLALPMEYRSEIVAQTSNQGNEIVREDKWNLLGALRNNLVMAKAGAQIINGLVGDVSIPVYAGSNVNWASETGAAADGGGAFSEVTMSPKRLTAYIDVSKQFLIQDSIAANQLLLTDLSNAIQEKLEQTIFGTASGNTTTPAGLFYNPSLVYSGTSDWANIVKMESTVAGNNALTGNLAYIFHPSTLGTLKTTAKTANTASFIAENTLVNGYPFYTSAALPTCADGKYAIFGNFNDYIIGNWGGLDITVDQFTQAVNGKVRIIVNTYWDAKPRRTVSFAKAGLK